MNSVFENIIEKLEEMIHPKQLYFCKYARGGCKHLDNDDKDCMECVVENAIEIVKQEAEQYKCGWIPCSDRLPEEDEKVYISTKTERVYVGVYTKRYGFEKREGFICDDGFMWMNTALAWKPYVLPAPYQPKGE